jgi:hypothetical protein
MINAADVMCDRFPEPTRIQQFRDIAKSGQGGQIDGYVIDSYDAGLICSVHDACQKETNRQALMEVPVPVLISICIKMIS